MTKIIDNPHPSVLIVKMSSLGDLFHALPTVRSLKTSLDAEIDWVVNREYGEIARGFKDVDHILEFPRNNFFANQRTFLKNLRSRKYDIVIDLQGLLKSAYVSLAARGKRKIAPSFCREFAHLFYREVAGEKDKDRHAIEECLDVVRYLGLAPDYSPPPLEFPAFKPNTPHPRIAMAPLSRWNTKNWAPDNFIALGKRLHDELGAMIYLIGSPQDRSTCTYIAEGIGANAENLAGSTSLPELGGLLRKVDLLISVDSGPVHIASALQTPVLGIYGLTDPRRTGPFGSIHAVIRAENPTQNHGDFRKTSKANQSVINTIAPEQVFEKARELLS